MQIRRELLLSVGTLVALNLVLAFGSIALFVRMGPAIERILQENVYTIDAAELILAELAESGGQSLEPSSRQRVHEALAKAQRNVTEEAERPVLAQLEEHLPAAESGDAAARRRVIASARELIRVNHEAMRDADAEAGRLGRAGAWAAVLVGFLSFLLGLLLLGRLRRRFIDPLLDLHRTLQGAASGERLRRCRNIDAPYELVEVKRQVNALLDERMAKAVHEAGRSASPARLRDLGVDPDES